MASTGIISTSPTLGIHTHDTLRLDMPIMRVFKVRNGFLLAMGAASTTKEDVIFCSDERALADEIIASKGRTLMRSATTSPAQMEIEYDLRTMTTTTTTKPY